MTLQRFHQWMVQIAKHNFRLHEGCTTLQQIIFQLPFTIGFTNQNTTAKQVKKKA